VTSLTQSDPFLDGLNAPQREAVLTTEGPVLMLAGAGTGKTAALTARLANLVRTRRAWPSEILCVTFTNKAAREMKERVGHQLGGAVEGMPWLGTFHSVAAKMLRRHAELAGLQSNFTIIDTDDQLRLLKQLIQAEGLDEKRWPARQLAGCIDRWKNKGLNPSDLDAAENESYANGKGKRFYQLYQDRLKALGACDFGDLLLHVVNILRSHREILEQYQQRFKYILVDEYQDTNQVQYLWLRLLAQTRKNICVVGDDDQCLAAGTMVSMADGTQKAIEQVQPGDMVQSCYGKQDFRPAQVIRAVAHQSTQELIRITTSTGKALVSTPEHIHFADFVAKESPQRYFTYLMYKQGYGYRIGTSQIYTNGQKRAIIGFKQRCLQEHADAVWLIADFASDSDAREYEHRLSLRYGITTLPFVARKGRSTGGLVHDQARLDRLHRELESGPKGQQLLLDHDLSADAPHHVPQTSLGKRRVFNLTLYAERRGLTPMHRMSLSGCDSEGRDAIESAGLSARSYKRNPANWRFETLYRDMAKVDEIRDRLASRMDLMVSRKANLLGTPLALQPARNLRSAMVVACAEGSYDHIVQVERVAGDGMVYDLDVKDTHNFIANGIVTHNSIYSWRGAEVANILRFEKDFPGAKVIKLEQNYRSTPAILAAASGLIDANNERIGKTLWTEQNGGDKLRVIGVWDGPEEARRVGEEIERLEREGASLDQCAILVRAQFQTREFEDRFIAIGLNYRIIGGFRFYERAEVRDALAYLRIIAQPQDDLAFERIYNTPKRGLGDKTLEKMHRLARARGIPLFAAALEIVDTDELPARARGTLLALMRDFARWRDLAKTASPAELVRTLLDESGYTAMLQAERSAESAGRLENLTELARAMEEYETLGDFLEHVSLVMDNDAASDEEKVTIMTIHGAKGLEFEQLFLVGWEEGVFPSQRALDEGGLASLEEERRLAYVAITRAKKRCTILHAANRRIYGQWTSSIPSRFIAELPAAHVEQESTLSGGASMWRANWSERADPFADVARDRPGRADSRGPGWQRAASTQFDPAPRRIAESTRSAASFAAKPRSDIAVGARVFHDKFGYGVVAMQEGNKLEIDFETTGRKRVIDSFVRLGE
jgi:DNA helicase II / ATP-dependent DNA helicase PcrA